MPAALIEIRDVEGNVSCSVHWCDDNAESAKYDPKSAAHRAATMVIAYMDQACGRVGEASITTAADIEAGLNAARAAAEPCPA